MTPGNNDISRVNYPTVLAMGNSSRVSWHEKRKQTQQRRKKKKQDQEEKPDMDQVFNDDKTSDHIDYFA